MGVHEVEIQVEVEGRRGGVAINNPPERLLADVVGALGIPATSPLWFNGAPVDPEKPIEAFGLCRGGLLSDVAPKRRPPAPLLAARILTGPGAGTTVPLAAGTTSLGRAELADPSVSVRHAAVHISEPFDDEEAGLFVADLGSTNGTAVDSVDVGREWIG